MTKPENTGKGDEILKRMLQTPPKPKSKPTDKDAESQDKKKKPDVSRTSS